MTKTQWRRLWKKLALEEASGKEEIDVTTGELIEIERVYSQVAALVAKLNPPEDCDLPLDIRLENDAKFKTHIKKQFAYLGGKYEK